MSQYYRGRRTKNIYDPQINGTGGEPFKLSRSKLDLFLECPRCFYLDRRLGVDRPPGFPFSLNAAVDHLLKKEFDTHRVTKTSHPLMKHYSLAAVPLAHPKLAEWRDNFVGVQFHHAATNFIVTGAVDDLWIYEGADSPQHKCGEVIVVDYKATSKDGEVSLDAEWQEGYKRQMEIYQWLLRQNGLAVSATGYFVYVNGHRDAAAFGGRLEFDVKLIPYTGRDTWVEGTLAAAARCLASETWPQSGPDCDYCVYREAVAEVRAAGASHSVKEKKEERRQTVRQRAMF